MAKDSTRALDDFVTELVRALGENIVSIVQFGEAVRGAYDEKRPQLEVLVILGDASPTALRPVGRHIAAWVKAGHPPPLVFAEREWRQSSDVFPIEIEEMREAHRVLRGGDPFEGVATTTADLRQELEREIRGKVLQLRAEFAAAEADGRALGELLIASAKTFFILFRAVLRVAGSTPPSETAALVRATAETAGVDPVVFNWVVTKLTGGQPQPPRLGPFDRTAVRYLEGIEQLALYVDGMTEGAARPKT